MRPLTLTQFDSPVGNMIIGGHSDKVYFIKIGSLNQRDTWLERWRSKHELAEPQYDSSAFKHVKDEFKSYFNHELTEFTFEMEWLGTDFQKRVWNALLTIPLGETWTYKQVAEAINHPKAIRAVGGAVNKNPISIAVPCHRVVGSDGSLTGYASGLDMKRYLLHHETKNESWLHLTS